jgi:hypothetical protein
VDSKYEKSREYFFFESNILFPVVILPDLIKKTLFKQENFKVSTLMSNQAINIE